MTRLFSAVLNALRSGRFISGWSFVAAVVLALTVMAPTDSPIGRSGAVPVNLATTATFLIALAVIAILERRLRSPRARIVAVTVLTVAAAALRPLAYDAWAQVAGQPPLDPGQLPFRIATNVLVWPVSLAIVALCENALHTLARTNAVLRDVAEELERSRERAERTDHEARETVDAGATALADAVARLPAPADAAAVRTLGNDAFRVWSHLLQERAEAPASLDDPGIHESTLPRRRRITLAPFRVPPRGVATLAYIVCTLPYAARTTTALELASGVVVVVALGTIVDQVARLRAFAAHRRASTIAFITSALLAACCLAVLALAGGRGPGIAFVALFDYTAFSIASGICAGAIHALQREQRRLSSAIALSQRAARDGDRPARDGLRRTAELLHRDGQGACVQYALTHLASPPSTHDDAALRKTLDDVIERMPPTYAAGDSTAGTTAILSLVETWARVMAIDADITPAARDALDCDPLAARDVYEIVAEGLLNAVKHSTEKRAVVHIGLTSTGAGPRVNVRVRSFGPAPVNAQLRPASHARELGAQLLTEREETVLEAAFAVAPASRVVSTEHPPKGHESAA
jgi:heme exporter protein D